MHRHHWMRWLLGGVGLAVVLAVGVPFVFIHFVEGPAKPNLTLPAPTSTSSATAPSDNDGSGSPSGDLSGTWTVSSGSQAGYRVQEVLFGQSATAVGRTPEVTGTFVLSGRTVSAASFTVQMDSVVSDQSQRDVQFDNRIMDVADYPTATFRLTRPIDLATVPTVGQTIHVSGTGILSMHDVARTITIPLSAERLASGIEVLGDTNIVFSNWDIQNPSVAGFVTTADHGTLEVLLHLVRA